MMAPWIWTALEYAAGLAIIAVLIAAALLGAIWFEDRQNSAGVSDE